MIESKGILIYAEIMDGCLSNDVKELFGGARKLADDLREKLSCLLVGEKISNTPNEAIQLGADSVFVNEDSLLRGFLTDVTVQILERYNEHLKPRLLLMPHHTLELAARFSFRKNANLVSDCIEIGINRDSNAFLLTKPIHGGIAHLTTAGESLPQIVTVRPKSMVAATEDERRTGEIIPMDLKIDEEKIRIKQTAIVTTEEDGLKIEDANVVVAGGRGIGGKEAFISELGKLAELFNGTTGCSRPPVDLGWMPVKRQIGLTGKIIAPEVYFAIGISGSSQHTAGCSGAKTIIAINNDPDAPIFKLADYGVIEDYQRVLPAFCAALTGEN